MMRFSSQVFQEELSQETSPSFTKNLQLQETLGNDVYGDKEVKRERKKLKTKISSFKLKPLLRMQQFSNQ